MAETQNIEYNLPNKKAKFIGSLYERKFLVTCYYVLDKWVTTMLVVFGLLKLDVLTIVLFFKYDLVILTLLGFIMWEKVNVKDIVEAVKK